MGQTRKALSFIFMSARWIWLLPVYEKNKKFTFHWKSLRTFYFILLYLIAILQLLYDVSVKITPYVFLMKRISTLLMMFGLLRFVKFWTQLERDLNVIDHWMKCYDFPKHLKKRIQMLFVLFAVFALMYEFLLNVFLASKNFSSKTIAIDRRILPPLLKLLNDNIIVSFILKIIHLQLFSVVGYTDLINVSVSFILSTRFRQISKRMKMLVKNKIKDESIWRQIREDYQRLHAFCYKLDDVTGYMSLASISSSVFVILGELQNLLSSSITGYAFFTCGLTYVICRCFCVCYFGGNVYNEATKSVEYLNCTPSEIYNREIERLIIQIRQDPPRLTAKKIFTISHSLIIKIVAAVASHELILLQ